MSETATTPTNGTRISQFHLRSLTGLAIVAGEYLLFGDTLEHDEYGELEVRGYGWSNGALGEFLKLAPTDDSEAPEQWSLERNAPNSISDAFERGELRLGGESE